MEKFFDRVNHDILMGLVAKRVEDRRIRRLIRGFLTAGVLTGGLVSPTEEGTPQGRPLSPLLSNLMLNELDRELERRSHRFVRGACPRAAQKRGPGGRRLHIYVRSRRAGERVMASVERFLTGRLKLKLNAAKSAVDRPVARQFLGFSFTSGKEPRRRLVPNSRSLQEAGSRTDAPHPRTQPGADGRPIGTLSEGMARPISASVKPPRCWANSARGSGGAWRSRLGAVEARLYPLQSVATARHQARPGGQHPHGSLPWAEGPRELPWPVAAQQ